MIFSMLPPEIYLYSIGVYLHPQQVLDLVFLHRAHLYQQYRDCVGLHDSFSTTLNLPFCYQNLLNSYYNQYKLNGHSSLKSYESHQQFILSIGFRILCSHNYLPAYFKFMGFNTQSMQLIWNPIIQYHIKLSKYKNNIDTDTDTDPNSFQNDESDYLRVFSSKPPSSKKPNEIPIISYSLSVILNDVLSRIDSYPEDKLSYISNNSNEAHTKPESILIKVMLSYPSFQYEFYHPHTQLNWQHSLSFIVEYICILKLELHLNILLQILNFKDKSFREKSFHDSVKCIEKHLIYISSKHGWTDLISKYLSGICITDGSLLRQTHVINIIGSSLKASCEFGQGATVPLLLEPFQALTVQRHQHHQIHRKTILECLRLSSLHGHIQILTYLLNAYTQYSSSQVGIPFNKTGSEIEPLACAVYSGHVEMVQILLNHKYYMRTVVGDGHDTSHSSDDLTRLLVEAGEMGRWEIVKMLAQYGQVDTIVANKILKRSPKGKQQ